MQVTLKIHRSNPDTGETGVDEFTVDAPETATLLDCLDQIKDEQDGSLTYRKSCRMAVCGSCGMRMDGAAVLACKTPMAPVVEAGEVPVISPMGNLPVVKDLVVDMEPFWEKFRSIKPYLVEDDDPPAKEWRIQQEELDRIFKEALCIQCGCCVSECNSMEIDPDFMGPAALAKAARFVGDVRDRDRKERLRTLNGHHGVWDCTRCYFCNQRCPKGVDPRDAIAKLGRRDLLGGHAVRRRRPPRPGVRRVQPHDRLPARDRAGAVQLAEAGDGHQVRDADGQVGQGAEPAQAPPGQEARRGAQAAQAAATDRRGRARRQAQGSHHRERAGFVNSSYAYYPGCLASLSQKELDTSTRAVAGKLGLLADRHPGIHLLRRR